MNHPTIPAIAARALHKSFKDTHALRDVSVSIEQGQICALLGKNGAGKTTFIKTALGLVTADRGDVQVLGEPAGSLAARRELGVMLQDVDLPDLLSAREHLTLFSSYYARPADVEAVIQMADLEGFADQRYKTLSGGQKRRVQFSVALIGQPKILFLDEPTTGLDGDARRTVWDNVRRLADGGTTVILTTHYLEEADALADRIVVLSDGRIIADDSASNIRNQVGGTLIRCETALDQSTLTSLPGVKTIETSGRLTTLLTDDGNAALGALLQRDPTLGDLTVRKPSLEEAFSELTQGAQH
ncbi:MAG: ABC transporter ATP-binding protein [Pseudomonadota bacterium]